MDDFTEILKNFSIWYFFFPVFLMCQIFDNWHDDPVIAA